MNSEKLEKENRYKFDAVEFMKKIKEKCLNAGWDVHDSDTNQSSRGPDFCLYKDEELFGYIDTFYGLKGRWWNTKREIAYRIINELKPKLYILTDGIEFHVSVRGLPFVLLHFIPGSDDYEHLAVISQEYAKDFFERQFSEQKNLKEK